MTAHLKQEIGEHWALALVDVCDWVRDTVFSAEIDASEQGESAGRGSGVWHVFFPVLEKVSWECRHKNPGWDGIPIVLVVRIMKSLSKCTCTLRSCSPPCVH